MKKTNTNGVGYELANAFAIVAKQKGKMKLHLPVSTDESLQRAWIMENDNMNAKYGFWYAGFMLLDPDTLDSWFTVTFIPNNMGGVDLVKTEVVSTVLRKLNIVKKLEHKGLNFGFFSLDKIEAKSLYNDWVSQVSKITSTTVIRFNGDGNEMEIPNTIPVFPSNSFTDFIEVKNFQQVLPTVSSFFSQFTTDELPLNDTLFYKEAIEITDENGNVSDVELSGTPQELINVRNTRKEEPGLYIRTGGQAGIPSFNMMEIYLRKEDGSRKILTRNLCTKTTYETYKKWVIRKSKSGPISSKTSVKIIIKGFSKTLPECGDFGMALKPINTIQLTSIK